MPDEENVVATWLNTVLNDDSVEMLAAVPGGFWWEMIPQVGTSTDIAVELPAGTYQMISGTDLVVINNRRVWSNQLWLLKITAIVGRDQTLSAGVDLMDSRLHDQRYVTVGSAMIYGVSREQSISQPVNEDGTQYRQRGGIYRIYARDAA